MRQDVSLFYSFHTCFLFQLDCFTDSAKTSNCSGDILMHPGLSWKTKKVRSRSYAHKNANSDCCDTSFQPFQERRNRSAFLPKNKNPLLKSFWYSLVLQCHRCIHFWRCQPFLKEKPPLGRRRRGAFGGLRSFCAYPQNKYRTHLEQSEGPKEKE